MPQVRARMRFCSGFLPLDGSYEGKTSERNGQKPQGDFEIFLMNKRRSYCSLEDGPRRAPLESGSALGFFLEGSFSLLFWFSALKTQDD